MNYLVLDTETSKCPVMNPWQPGSFMVAVGYCLNDGPVTTHLLRHATEFVKPVSVTLLEIQAAVDAADVIVAHNAKFDINWLKAIGINLEGKKLWCTLTADYLMSGQFRQSRKLNDVAARYKLGSKLDEVAKYWEQGYQTDEIPSDILLAYLAQDVSLTRDVYKFQYPIIKKNQLLKLAELTFSVADMLSDMEVGGVAFNKEQAEKYVAEYRDKLKEIDKEIFKFVGYEFNIGSSSQLSACLYGGYVKTKYREQYIKQFKSGPKTRERWSERMEFVKGLGFKPIDGTEGSKPGQYSTNKKIISQLIAETPDQKILLDLLLQRSKIDKIVETFITAKDDSGLLHKIGVDSRIHPSFNQTVTVTGRLSSSNPNGQNLPRKGSSPIKRCFVPVNGVMLNVDLCQIEFRIAAELSRDPVMIKELKEGIDTHADNAIRFFGAGKYARDSKEFNDLRQAAKIFTFRLLYGGSALGFFRDPNMPRYSLHKWEKIVEAYYEKYAGLRKWQRANVARVEQMGYLRNPSGRILRFKTSPVHGVVQYKESAVYNYPVQSSSSDVMYIAMTTLYKTFKEKGLRSKVVLQVHDSMVIDTFYDEIETISRLARKIFQSLPELCKQYWGWDICVPLDGDVEIGPNYGDLNKIDFKTDTITKCVLKFTDSSSEEINVQTYLDLIKDETYLRLVAERKLAKITFC